MTHLMVRRSLVILTRGDDISISFSIFLLIFNKSSCIITCDDVEIASQRPHPNSPNKIAQHLLSGSFGQFTPVTSYNVQSFQFSGCNDLVVYLLHGQCSIFLLFQ